MSDGLGGKLKEFFGFGDVDNYQDPYYNDSFRETEDTRSSRPEREEEGAYRSRTHSRRRDYAGSPGVSSLDTPARSRRYEDSGRITSTSANMGSATKEPSVVRVALSSYTQASELVELIKAGDVVVFNLGGMEKNEATRVLDFAAGLGRGVEAELKKLRGVRNFVLIPHGLTLEPSQLDQLVEDL